MLIINDRLVHLLFEVYSGDKVSACQHSDDLLVYDVLEAEKCLEFRRSKGVNEDQYVDFKVTKVGRQYLRKSSLILDFKGMSKSRVDELLQNIKVGHYLNEPLSEGLNEELTVLEDYGFISITRLPCLRGEKVSEITVSYLW